MIAGFAGDGTALGLVDGDGLAEGDGDGEGPLTETPPDRVTGSCAGEAVVGPLPPPLHATSAQNVPKAVMFQRFILVYRGINSDNYPVLVKWSKRSGEIEIACRAGHYADPGTSQRVDSMVARASRFGSCL